MAVQQTGLFNYTLDVPSDDPKENKRLGYRTPRSVLLPPYLYTNPFFLQFAEAIDEVFGPLVDEKIEILKNLRNMWPTDPALELQIANSAVDTPVMNDDSMWPQYERQIVVKQVNALGMNLQSAGLITDKQYQTISRWVGQYWFGKGTESFINFMNYCLGTKLTVIKLWTQDYKTFVPEGDPSIGTAIWDGGPWYPTSHVQIEASGGLQYLSPADLTTFFYEIANYNLVLQAIDLSFDLNFVDTLNAGETTASIVAVGLWADNVIVMSNYARYGAKSPPQYSTGAQVPASVYKSNNSKDALTTQTLLTMPDSWLQFNGKTYPAYTVNSRTPSSGVEIPTNVVGSVTTPLQISQVHPIVGPTQWIPIPGSSRSTARMPGYSTQPSVQQVAAVPNAFIGPARQFLLCNPDGWDDVAGTGLLTPYWNPQS